MSRRTRTLAVSIGVGFALSLGVATAPSSQAATSPHNRSFDRNINPATLTRSEVAALTPADLPRLPPQVIKALTTPKTFGMTETKSDVQRVPSTFAVRAATLDTCYTLTRDTWATATLGNRIYQVRNKARVCTDDGVYISETPIDLSQAWGNWGWVFSQWDVNTSGYCNSRHANWYHLLQARFRYAGQDLARLANQTTFWGSGGQRGTYC